MTDGQRAVAQAAAFIEQHADEPITLAGLAASVGLSPSHLQREFTRAYGRSPKRFQTALRAESLRRGLRDGASVTDAAYGAGFGSTRGVYEGAARQLAQPGPAYAPEPPAAIVSRQRAESTPMVASAKIARAPSGNLADAARPSPAREMAAPMAPAPAETLRLPPPTGAASDASDAATVRAIIARYFPETGADAGLTRWILFDHEGRVLRTGRWPSAQASGLRPYIESLEPRSRIAQFRVVRVDDGRGGSVSAALAWSGAEAPLPGP